MRLLLAASVAAALSVYLIPTNAQQGAAAKGKSTEKATIDRYCVGCHSDQLKTGGLSLQNADLAHTPEHAETGEKVIRKLRVGAMPPQGMPRDQAALDGLAKYLETSLDKAAAANPNPGRLSIHRLNRAEYANAIRDVFGLEIDSSALLPPDDESSGFDNIADVLRMSPALMERYLSASWNVSRLAVGNMAITPSTQVYRVRGDLSQDQHIDGLPLGSRGGIRVEHNFPLDGEYIIKVRMWRNTFDLMLGVDSPHDIEVALDGAPLKTVRVGGREDFVKLAENPGEFGIKLDEQLTLRIPVTAGVHIVTAYTALRSHAELEDVIKPFERSNVDSQQLVGTPAFDRVSIEGPFQQTGVGETASRKKIFTCRPKNSNVEVACAMQIVSTLGKQAFRRPLTDADTETLLSFYQRGRNKGNSFDAGIESAIQFILASPEFLVRFEADPAGIAPNTPYRISDLALASRLSFFLWSTIPDDELLTLAVNNKLHEPAVLKTQMTRMLCDPKSEAIVDNFAEQWLFLRNLKNFSPSLEYFPDFDDNLRRAMYQETRMFFESIMREDRSVMDLLNADYTFVNERLARHYNIPNVYGTQFRRVSITDENRRGLLGQASILTVTSYPNRTSPVQRGKWILTNILGVPPTPPPPDVPPLKDNEEGGAKKSLRERMELHRAGSVCAGCHKVMDPVGFALENFDGIGKWRNADDGSKIDPSGTLFEGSKVAGAAGLRQMIASRPDVFVGVMTEKMLTYALGRPLQPYDMPAVRKIVNESAKNQYKFSTIVAGIVDSVPFRMRLSASKPTEGGQ
jgi:mono/diheme cytochrome c family protein